LITNPISILFRFITEPKEFLPKSSTKISSIAESLIKDTKHLPKTSVSPTINTNLKPSAPEFKAKSLEKEYLMKATQSFHDVSPTIKTNLKPGAPEFKAKSLEKEYLMKATPSFHDVSPLNKTDLKPSAPEFVPGSNNAKVKEETSTKVRRNTASPTLSPAAMSQPAVSQSAGSQPSKIQPFQFTGTPNMTNDLHLMPTARVFVPMAANTSGKVQEEPSTRIRRNTTGHTPNIHQTSSLQARSQSAVSQPSVSQPAVGQPFVFTGTPNVMNNVHLMPTASIFVPMAANISGKVQEEPSNRIRRYTAGHTPNIQPTVSLQAKSQPALSQSAVRQPTVSQPASSQPFQFTGTPNMMSMVHLMSTAPTFVPMAANVSGMPATNSVHLSTLHAPNDIVNNQPMHIPANNGWLSASDIPW
jgi:hypothetical protein